MINSFTTSLKNLQTTLGIAILLTSSVVLSSCKKTATDTNVYAAISVYNASPTAATYDVYLGDTKLNPAALPLGGATVYTQQIAKAYDLKLTTAGRVESLITKSINLAPNTYNSFYLVGKPNAFDGIFVTDDLSGSSATNAFVRFINLSPDAPALQLAVTGGATVAASQTYKGVSSFVQVAAGAYSFDVKDNTTVKTTLPGVTLVANNYYTVITRGLITPTSGTDLAFGLQVVVNR